MKLNRNVVLSAITIVLIIGGIFIMDGQRQYLNVQADVSKQIYENTQDGSVIISGEDEIRYLNEVFGDRRYYKITEWFVIYDGNKYIVIKQVTVNQWSVRVDIVYDDNMYLIIKQFERPSEIQEMFMNESNKLVEKYDFPLIKRVEYKSNNPFALEIYKVALTYSHGGNSGVKNARQGADEG